VLSILFWDPSNQHEESHSHEYCCSFCQMSHPHSRKSRCKVWGPSGFLRLLRLSGCNRLKALGIKMPFDQTLGQPESLKRFLLSCRASLEGLELRLQVSHIWKIKPFISEEFRRSSTLVPLDPVRRAFSGPGSSTLYRVNPGKFSPFPSSRSSIFTYQYISWVAGPFVHYPWHCSDFA